MPSLGKLYWHNAGGRGVSTRRPAQQCWQQQTSNFTENCRFWGKQIQKFRINYYLAVNHKDCFIVKIHFIEWYICVLGKTFSPRKTTNLALIFTRRTQLVHLKFESMGWGTCGPLAKCTLRDYSIWPASEFSLPMFQHNIA